MGRDEKDLWQAIDEMLKHTAACWIQLGAV